MACCAGEAGCASTRTWGSEGTGGSVATGLAEAWPRGDGAMAGAVRESVGVPCVRAGVGEGRWVGGRPSGVYWVPASV